MASMKFITDEGKEVDIDKLQPIIIDGTKKVIITIPNCYNIDTEIVRPLDDFFGKGRWLITTQSLDIGVDNE